MKTIQAIYENGVFRPLERVELPEACKVEVYPKIGIDASPTETDGNDAALDAIYEILGRRYRAGRTDLAARHNEHQP